MEIDDFKQTWKHSDKNHKPSNQNIMDLIQHKSYGPVAALKRGYKKQMRIMLILPLLILSTNLNHIDKALSSILFWSYVVFCFSAVFYAWYNYRIVSKMDVMDRMVKSNLEQQISILDARMRWNIIGLRVALLFFIALTEVLPYIQHYSMLDKWHSLSPFIRYGVYIALLAIQYVVSRPLLHRKFGQHITYLKQLVNEMQ